MDFRAILKDAVDQKASDVFIVTGVPIRKK